MGNGFMFLPRDIRKWGWYKDSKMVHMLIHLMLEAQYQDNDCRGIKLKRGQLLTGRKQLSEETGLTEREVRTTIKRLANDQQITIKTTNKYSIITVCNYDSWQSLQKRNDQQTTSKKPTNDQQSDHYKKNIIKDNIEINNKDATASLQLEFEEPEVKSKVSDFDFDDFLDYFNKTLKANNSIIPSLRKIDERRKNVIHARIKDYGTDAIYEVVQKASVSSFMNGGGSKGWKANFDWMFGPDNFRKVLEGNYDDMDTKNSNVRGNCGFSNLQFPKDPRHGDIFNNHFYDANEDRWIADGEKDRMGRTFSVQLKKWLI